MAGEGGMNGKGSYVTYRCLKEGLIDDMDIGSHAGVGGEIGGCIEW